MTALLFYTLAKSKALADFLDAVSDERLPVRGKFVSLAGVWRKKTRAAGVAPRVPVFSLFPDRSRPNTFCSVHYVARGDTQLVATFALTCCFELDHYKQLVSDISPL